MKKLNLTPSTIASLIASEAFFLITLGSLITEPEGNYMAPIILIISLIGIILSLYNIFNKKNFEKKFKFLKENMFSIGWFGCLLLLTIIMIIQKLYMAIPFLLPFWIMGYYATRKDK